ncbi:MAG: phosphoribosylamine--glycine ligase [Candidatus Thorarchaeota archaeon]
MTRVLLIGNGAREHAIATALVHSGVEIIAHMDRMNPGIAKLANKVSINSILDFRKLPDLSGIDYAFIGPEAPLASGVSDFLNGQGVPCVAPSKTAAMIETSKSFARRILQDTTPDANPRHSIVRSLDDLRRFEDVIGVENIVVKPDGLTGGKGVKIFGEHLHSRTELEKYAVRELSAKGVVVLEEKLEGIEFTVQAFVDGAKLVTMPLVRDYKRAYDGDKGPNTGSMGSYSTENHGLSFVDEEDLSKAKLIMQATIDRIKKVTRTEYKGILYGQFMKTETGIKVIEYNARFGDPEALNVLSILNSSMDVICQQIIDGRLTNAFFEKAATVCVYVVPEGYPEPEVIKDSPIDTSVASTADIYYASVYEKDGQILTTGSRAVGVLAKGNSVAQAKEIAYANASRIKGKVRYRSDIAQDA